MLTMGAPRWLQRFLLKAGFRGSFLFILGAVDLVYGHALHGVADKPNVTWWPASMGGELAGVSLHFWALLWQIVGVILLTGPFVKRDQWHFACAVLLKAVWALSVLWWWFSTEAPGGYGVAAIYTGLMLIVLLVSAWPESVPITRERKSGDQKP